ncbi:MAG TPA: hypothetical protein ENK19_05060 [Acidobacteria bacterium]|nr:hypothetical protein [Acidobacteriota bacterium]
MRRWGAALLLVGATALVPRTAVAQLFGQWSWDAVAGVESRSYQTELDGVTLTDYTQRSFHLGLGLNGFIIHPAIARFRLALDGTLSNYSGTRAPDTNRWGIRGQLALLPYGRYPSNFFLSLNRYDYVLASDDPLATTGLADTTSSWGARIRLRGGIFRGLTAGTEQTDTSFVDPMVRDEVFRRQYLDWAGGSGRINHHYRLERRYRRYGRTRYTSDDYTLTMDEHGLVSDRWRWDLSGIGFHRSTDYESSSNTVDTGRLRNRFVYTTARKDLLDLSYTGGFSRSDGTPGTSQSHTGTVRYTWYTGKSLQVIPSVSYSLQLARDVTLTAPSAATNVVWTHTADSYDLTLNGGVGGSWIDVSWDDGRQKTTTFTWSLGGTVGSGNEDRIRAELDLYAASNELRTVGDPLLDLPDLGTGYERIGTQDSARARVTLRRRFARWHLSGYLEHRRRQQEATTLPTIEVDSDVASLTADGPRIGMMFNAGSTDGRSGEQRQNVDFYSASVHWSPLRYLSLRASYVSNRSRVELGPDVDRQRIEVTARLHYGRYALFAQAWDQRETVTSSPRRNRGLWLGLSARFAGWLPFVSAPQRRGIIR